MMRCLLLLGGCAFLSLAATAADPIALGQKTPPLPQAFWSSPRPVTLGQLQGKATIVYFFQPGTGCGSCDAFLLHVRRLKMRFGAQRLQAIGISDCPTSQIKVYAAEWKNAIPLGQDRGGSYTERFMGKIEKFPYVAILDKAGRLAWLGRDRFHAQITEEVTRILQPNNRNPNSTPPAIIPKKKVAIIIGLGRDPLSERPLPGSVQNAMGVAAVLNKQLGFQNASILVDSPQISKACRPTGAVIRKTIQSVAEGLSEDHLLLIYYSGQALEVGPDGAPEDIALLANNTPNLEMLSLKDISDLLQKSKAQNLLIADVSHKQSRTMPLGRDPYLYRDQVTKYIALLSSSRGDYSYPLDPDKNEAIPQMTAFTHCLAKGIQGAADRNRDRALTGAELFHYVRDELTLWSRQTGKLQTPCLLRSNNKMDIAIDL